MLDGVTTSLKDVQVHYFCQIFYNFRLTHIFNGCEDCLSCYLILFCLISDLFTVASHTQEDFLKLVYKETILVGHSVENDLLALKTSHNLVIDTAVLYKHPCGGSHKSALRVLAKRFLSKEIQQSGNGHDSTEDSRTAMELALLKINHGEWFYFPLCIKLTLLIYVKIIVTPSR